MSDQRLRRYHDRVKKLSDERAALTADIAEVLKEAEGGGYDPATIRRVVGEDMKRERDPAGFAEKEEIADLYRDAIHGGATPGKSFRVGQAGQMFAAGKTVREVAQTLSLSKSNAGRLRQIWLSQIENGTADNVVPLKAIPEAVQRDEPEAAQAPVTAAPAASDAPLPDLPAFLDRSAVPA